MAFWKSHKPAPLMDNGIFDMRKTDIEALAAVHQSGLCYVAKGYRRDPDFLEKLRTHQTNKLLPKITSFQERSLEEIADFYEGNTRKTGQATEDREKTSGERRLLRLIDDAAKMKASDIRIIQHDTYTAVRIRVAGREVDYGHNWTPEEGINAISAAFVMQDEGTGEVSKSHHEFQSFSISPKDAFPLPRNVVKLRVQTGYHESETTMGSSLVARLFFNDTKETGTLEDLGHDTALLEALARVRGNLKGCVLIGGETGDGKSTTLVRALEQAYDDHGGRIAIVTLEDPVEYTIRRPGVMQIPLRSAGDEQTREASYRKALRNFVRINPDLGMLSEIRDGAGGREALQFASSGHGLYSTIHVESANGIPFRMIALGVPPEEISQTGLLRLLMKQTLVPLLCEGCKRPVDLEDLDPAPRRNLTPILANLDSVFLHNSEGCETCRSKYRTEQGADAWAGYRRLFAVGEFIEPDDAYNEFVRTNNPNGARAHWLKPLAEGGMGGTELSQKTTELVLTGQLDPFDCLLRKGDLSKRLTPILRSQLRWGVE